jgi:transcriptional/translational regulatory protein YebC/TACO1
LVKVRTSLQNAGIDYESADVQFVPSLTIPVEDDVAERIFKLLEAIEDSDEVQNVYSNFDVSDSAMAQV